jgi:hypothetical protein
MALEDEISKARKEIYSDGYDMSVGELINLYRDTEIVIQPEFQRLFRWEPSRKTRFIESLLLGIPIPPIFVYQDEKGVWELIDGLQRLSTIFQLVEILRNADGNIEEPLILEGTNFLPSLAGKRWDADPDGPENGLGVAQQLQIKRARMRVEILKHESDPLAKYELFQRLNTGGAALSEQEVRNCVAVMIDRSFYDWLRQRAENPSFVRTINQTEVAIEKQAGTELALRFFAFRNVPYLSGLDVHEYLDKALVSLAQSKVFDREAEKANFEATFELIDSTLGDRAFKKWNGSAFTGKFLMSVFEVCATRVSKNLDRLMNLEPGQRSGFLEERLKALWNDSEFTRNSGAGVRGTTRLANLLPMAEAFFKSE